MSLLTANINAINQQIGNIQSNVNIITSNTFSNYNQLTQYMSQLSSVYNPIYYGVGNITCSNIVATNSYNLNGTLTFLNVATYTGRLTMTNGNISSTIGNVILSNGNILSSSGNIVLSNGNINFTRGNININNGNIRLALGNINLLNGDANISGSVYSEGISTTAGQEPFKIQYDTTATVNSGITITFDTPFVNVPTVIASGFNNSSAPPIVYLRTISNTQVQLYAKDQAGNDYGNLKFTWVAFGV